MLRKMGAAFSRDALPFSLQYAVDSSVYVCDSPNAVLTDIIIDNNPSFIFHCTAYHKPDLLGA